MRIRTASEWPMKLALRLLDWQIIDACEPQTHQAMFVELPIFIPVRAEPITRVIMRFIGESHRNAVSVVSPDFFNESVVQLFRPLALEESNDFLPSVYEFRAISPARVNCV